MAGRLFLLACLVVAALPSATPPPRANVATAVSAAFADDGLPAFADDDATDDDDGLGDLDADADDDALPGRALRLRAACLVERIAAVTSALPESAALASLFRPPCHAAV
ncbi:MAG TPA: hypothetical protein VN947_11405 [Polyangia bacterium]|nr:hypothetical protein [Polyangia bacterium]